MPLLVPFRVDLVDVVYRDAGQPRTRLRGTPTWLLRLAGLGNPGALESVEMNYEFTAPFVVDSSRIADKFGLRATPVEEALAETLAAYRTATT